MKVVAINGSPKKEGNTYIALKTVLEELQAKGVETEIINIGAENIRGCIACGACRRNQNKKCVINDKLNEILPKMEEADGIIIGSPVYYASIAGTLKCFLDRAFYVAASNGGLFRHKVGAAVAVARRAGAPATFDHIAHYITIAEMFMPSSTYWNIAHGQTPGQVVMDEEGIQTMQTLGKNFAFLLQAVEKNKENLPERTEKIWTNFVR